MRTCHTINTFFSKYVKADILMYINFVFFVHEHKQQPLSVAHEKETDVLLPFPSLKGLQFFAAVSFYCKKPNYHTLFGLFKFP